MLKSRRYLLVLQRHRFYKEFLQEGGRLVGISLSSAFLHSRGGQYERHYSGRRTRDQAAALDEGDQQTSAAGVQQTDDLLSAGNSCRRRDHRYHDCERGKQR